jgi:hypothetical protein
MRSAGASSPHPAVAIANTAAIIDDDVRPEE